MGTGMRFTNPDRARRYIEQQPQRLRRRMHAIRTKIWDREKEEWVEVTDVVLGPPTRPIRRKKVAKFF